MKTRVENFKAKQSLVLSNSFGIINKEKDVELNVTVGIVNEERGYFELYDILSGGDNWYAEGSIQFDGKNALLKVRASALVVPLPRPRFTRCATAD